MEGRDRAPMVLRPVRTAAIVAGVVAFVCTGAVFAFAPDAPVVLAFAVGYAVVLAWYVIGLFLASRFRITRWWWLGSALPLMGMWGNRLVLTLWPESFFFSWWPVIGGVTQWILVSWLSAGCVLAACGWWSHARERRSFRDG